jgi:hypothetical protein
MRLSIKGAMVIMANDMMPPVPVAKPQLKELLMDIARLLIRGLEHHPASSSSSTT